MFLPIERQVDTCQFNLKKSAEALPQNISPINLSPMPEVPPFLFHSRDSLLSGIPLEYSVNQTLSFQLVDDNSSKIWEERFQRLCSSRKSGTMQKREGHSWRFCLGPAQINGSQKSR